jgi:hypothetical protein
MLWVVVLVVVVIVAGLVAARSPIQRRIGNARLSTQLGPGFRSSQGARSVFCLTGRLRGAFEAFIEVIDDALKPPRLPLES